MSYFLGFVPDTQSESKINDVVKHISPIFDDLGIPVRWIKPDTFHITLYYLGEHFSFINDFLLKKKISKVNIQKIQISFNSVKVGISRNYKELIYLEVKEGGEELRELLLKMRRILGGKDVSMFVPHLTIGRISKDLSQEEYRNVVKDVSRVSKGLKLNDIKFVIDSMYLIKSEKGGYSYEMKLKALE